jgi:hypothetical protein
MAAWSRRIARPGDADYTMTFDGPGVIAFGTALTAQRKVILPYASSGPGNNLFDGWGPEIWRLGPAVGTQNILIRNSADNATLFTIPAGTPAGRWKLRFDRSSLTGAGGLGHFTLVYLGPVAGPETSQVAMRGPTESVTLTAADAPIQIWHQALTANCTATLPSTGLTNGVSSFTFVVRAVPTLGSFSLTIDGAGARNFTFAAGQQGHIRYVWINGYWEIVERSLA